MTAENKVQIVKAARITDLEKEEMFALISTYFSNVAHQRFMGDMAEKDWVIVMREKGGKLCGFSTVEVLRERVDDREVVYVYSGDTIVEPQYWQSNLLAPAFGFFMLRMIGEHDGLPVYWFLITKGYRTYRFLPVYFRKFFPTYREEIPGEYDRLLKYICRKKFADYYDPESGIISFNGSKDHLNEEMCRVPQEKRRNPHVKYFLERNPYYYRGDELACIADISKENLNERAYRIMLEKQIKWVE